MSEDTDTELSATQEGVANVMSALCRVADEERQASDSYAKLFKAMKVDGLKGLVTEVETGMKSTLDAMKVLETLQVLPTERSARTAVFEFVMLIPYMHYKLEKYVTETQGMPCCVDKATFHVAQKLESLLDS